MPETFHRRTRILPAHPFMRSHQAAIAIGAVLFLAGSWFLYDAWEGRGKPTPRFLRPVMWF